jgi:hypothetical protein
MVVLIYIVPKAPDIELVTKKNGSQRQDFETMEYCIKTAPPAINKLVGIRLAQRTHCSQETFMLNKNFERKS